MLNCAIVVILTFENIQHALSNIMRGEHDNERYETGHRHNRMD